MNVTVDRLLQDALCFQSDEDLIFGDQHGGTGVFHIGVQLT
jgi:hypothetical protein